MLTEKKLLHLRSIWHSLSLPLQTRNNVSFKQRNKLPVRVLRLVTVLHFRIAVHFDVYLTFSLSFSMANKRRLPSAAVVPIAIVAPSHGIAV
jgi:hypothetical protein